MSWHLTRPFTPADDQKIRACWGKMGLYTLAKQLDRHPETVERQAERLGLPVTRQDFSAELRAERAGRDADRHFLRHFTAIARRRGWHVHTKYRTAA